MAVVTGDKYLEFLVKFVESNADRLIDGTVVLKLNPVGLRYVQSRLEALEELERLSTGAPVDYLRAYVSDLGDHRALEQLRRILRLIPSLKVVSALPRDPSPLYLVPFLRLKVLELRGCDLSTSAAKGLVELRFTLEKLVCHDSTDALRHVFASRIAEIKDSAQWKRLSFVSCACNGLVIMDESLQLLPVVETLDLSRNKFAKANNLWKCTRLKHLDLGFNSLRSIKPFGEVSCKMVKLVLRNNALTSLKGIENMRSLEEVDLSYNIISNFSEVEILASLPCLLNLWLEGNPLCYARWFRPQVFSFFPHPEILKLDGKSISASELWKRQLIVASRTKQPASFGFYSPIKDDADTGDGRFCVKRKRFSRLASIQREEQTTYISSEKDLPPCDNEIESKDENDISTEEAEIEDLMKRIESMKKEDSVLWLQEFKEWMNRSSDYVGDASKLRTHTVKKIEKVSMKSEAEDDDAGTSRYVSDSAPLSADESSIFNLESETSFADTSTVSAPRYLNRIDEATTESFMEHNNSTSIAECKAGQEDEIPFKSGRHTCTDAGNLCFSSLAVPRGDNMSSKNIVSSSAAVDDIPISLLLSSCPGSPPHYEEDILHRRQNLEEEFLQLSAHSFSVASSDSDTSCSEGVDDSAPGMAIVDQYTYDNPSGRSLQHSLQDSSEDVGETYKDEIPSPKWNGVSTSTSATKECILPTEADKLMMSDYSSCGRLMGPAGDSELPSHFANRADWLEKKKSRKPTRRMISLWEEDDIHGCIDKSNKSNYNKKLCKCDSELERKEYFFANDLSQHIPVKNHGDSMNPSMLGKFDKSCSGSDASGGENHGLIGAFFDSNIADSGANENSVQYVQCNCLVLEDSGYNEREVVVLRSSRQKLYIILVDARDGPGTSPEMVGCHNVEDIRDVFVGLGLLFLRVCFEVNVSYLFITRSSERSRDLLSVLDFFSSSGLRKNFALTSLEQTQINHFEKYALGCTNTNLLKYSMVLFWHNSLKEDLWLSRSLFVLEKHLFVCSEDLSQFGCTEKSFSPSYLSLDSRCPIVNVTEMVIETPGSLCISLAFVCTSEFRHPENRHRVKEASGEKPSYDVLMWKLKWFCRESLVDFVVLLKAIYAQATSSSLSIRYESG